MLKEVQLSAPSVDLLVGDDGRVNLAQLVPESEAAPAGEESSPPRVRIGRLAVTQGRIGLVDNSREQPFSATVAPVRFTLEDFRTDVGYENAYEFAGTTLAGEQLEWSGQFTVQPLGSTGRFSVRDLKAATLDSYAATTLPFELASGQASLSGNYRFALAPTLALDLALPLLQIRDVCVKERRGTDATPVELAEVELHEVVLSYEKRDVGAKRVDVKGAHVEVAKQADGSISSSLLPVSETDQLNQLAKALIERPQLRLSVPLTVVTAKDSDAMARVALAGKLPPGAAEPPADEAAKRMRVVALEKIYKDTLKAAPAYLEQTETDDGIDVDARLQFLERALLDGLRPDDAALTSLAQQRARAVQDTLLAHTELSPERVFITAERSEGKSEGNSVRMEMKLE